MVLFSIADDEGYVFALRREGFDWKPLPAGAEVLSQNVAAFRRGLDVEKVGNAQMRLIPSGCSISVSPMSFL
jgi:hypothetical protein